MQFKPGKYTAEQLIQAGVLEIGDGYRSKNSELSAHGLPFARAGNINEGFRFEAADRFPYEDIAKAGNKVSRPGDVVFTSKGTVGRFAFVTERIERFVYSPQLCYWRSLASEILLPRYLYFWIQGPEFMNQVDYLKGQTDMADYVSLRDQRRMAMTIPPVDAQKEIASTLGALDDRIFLLRNTNATLESIARALFKSWFIDFDPVRAKEEGREPEGMDAAAAALFPSILENPADGSRPRGWTMSSLYELANYVNGAAYRAFEPNAERRGLPIVKIAELKAGITAQTAYSNVPMPEKYKIENGDLLFSWSGNPDTSIDTFFWGNGTAWLNQHIFRVVPRSPVTRSFVYLLLRHLRPVFAELARNKQTTGLGHVTVADLKRLRVSIPDERLLMHFDRTVVPMLEQMQANDFRIKNLAAIRDAVLPRLMSGNMRISEAQEELEGASV